MSSSTSSRQNPSNFKRTTTGTIRSATHAIDNGQRRRRIRRMYTWDRRTRPTAISMKDCADVYNEFNRLQRKTMYYMAASNQPLKMNAPMRCTTLTHCHNRCLLKKVHVEDWRQSFIVEHRIRKMYRPKNPCIPRRGIRAGEKFMRERHRESLKAYTKLISFVQRSDITTRHLENLVAQPVTLSNFVRFSTLPRIFSNQLETRPEDFLSCNLLVNVFRLTKEKLGVSKRLKQNGNLTNHIRRVVPAKFVYSIPTELQSLINNTNERSFSLRNSRERYDKIRELLAAEKGNAHQCV